LPAFAKTWPDREPYLGHGVANHTEALLRTQPCKEGDQESKMNLAILLLFK
jgi:hypothetical protein